MRVQLNQLIGNLLHVSAGLQTELQFLTTTGHCSDGTAGSLPRAIELIEDCIRYATSITGESRRHVSADAPMLQADSDKDYRIPVDEAAQVLMAAVNTGGESCLGENTKY